MSPCSRRAALRASLVAVGAALAGCLGTSGDDSSPDPTPEPTPSKSPTGTQTPEPLPFETPAPGECEATDPPRPTPVAGYEPKSYPTYPETLSVGSAEEFAAAYEESYRYNAYLAGEAGSHTEDIQINANAQRHRTETVGEGFLVSVEGLLGTSERTGEDTVVSDEYVSAVYYLAPSFALRGGFEGTPRAAESLRSLEVTASTIVCRE